jgi:phenylacetate-coenzyme A ligase PaaK-like adenylate-forming protein
VQAFVADPELVGVPFQGGYYVCASSGTTGDPGMFVHDADAVAVYRALTTRVDRAWLSGVQWLRLARQGLRWATVVGTGGHFAGESWTERERRHRRRRWGTRRVISAQRPLAEVVAALDALDPALVTAYPSVLELLAEERAEGRLHIRPVLVETAGESMPTAARARVAAALGCPVHDAYGASEFELMAFDCPTGWLHVNSDWLVLEPVDADLRPTPPGEPSHTVLLTNLANRVQPLIRYDLGDSVVAQPDRCPCGSPLPAIRVEGRRDDVLRLTAADDRRVSVPPLAVGAVVERTPGVHRWQLVQDGPSSVRVRLEARSGAAADAVWRDVAAELSAYFADQGLAQVTVVRASEPVERSATSGKLRQVIGLPLQAPGSL